MTNTKQLAAAFLQKAQNQQMIPVRGSINAFNSLFSVQELTDQETRSIERILVEGYEPGEFPEGGVDSDVFEIKRLTKELKAIKRQELVLIGERISSAREVFKKYKKRSFRDWMEFTFGSFKTGYNYLSFYDLYRAFPEEFRDLLKDLPAKAIYVLASRDAPIEAKVEIVRRSSSQERASELIARIHRSLGGDEREAASNPSRILTALERAVSFLQPNQLNLLQRQRLDGLIRQLQDILSPKN